MKFKTKMAIIKWNLFVQIEVSLLLCLLFVFRKVSSNLFFMQERSFTTSWWPRTSARTRSFWKSPKRQATVVKSRGKVACPCSSAGERRSCKLLVLGSTPSEGCWIGALIPFFFFSESTALCSPSYTKTVRNGGASATLTTCKKLFRPTWRANTGYWACQRWKPTMSATGTLCVISLSRGI